MISCLYVSVCNYQEREEAIGRCSRLGVVHTCKHVRVCTILAGSLHCYTVASMVVFGPEDRKKGKTERDMLCKRTYVFWCKPVYVNLCA